MQNRKVMVAGGVSFVVGALAFVFVFSYLAANFDYPQVLDGSAAEVLPRLREGGSVMRAVWAIYAFLPLLIVPGAVGATELRPVFTAARERASQRYQEDKENDLRHRMGDYLSPGRPDMLTLWRGRRSNVGSSHG